MHKIYFTILLLLGLLTTCFSFDGIKEKRQSKYFDFKKQNGTTSILALDSKTLDINQIYSWFSNDGEFFFDHRNDVPGFCWPKNSMISAIFSAGFWVGAKVQVDTGKQIRLAATDYSISEYRPGRILPNITTEDFTLPHLRVYRVRPLIDIPNSNVDYLEWPVDQGAQWIDVDENGNWDPNVDKIGIIFPDKIEYPDMITFCVYNDADPIYHNVEGGQTIPLGVEVRQTSWAYQNVFSDVQFLRFQIFNKSNSILDSTFFSIWCDPDLGNAFDDYVGCDTISDSKGKKHNLAFVYNADDDDEDYGYGVAPPALGFKLLQGPIQIGSDSDTGIFFGKRIPNYKNSDMSSFRYICKHTNPICSDPSIYFHTYNTMRGLNNYGKPWFDNNGDTTKFMFAGDPVTGTGWLNSHYTSPHDERFAVSVGPLTMAPGDSQEVIYTVFMARGISNLNSITVLRSLSELMQQSFDNQFVGIPQASIVSHNLYSSPFLINVHIEGALSISASLISGTNQTLGTAELFDDGSHNDSLASDGIWGNWLHASEDSGGASLSLHVKYISGDSITWKRIITNITTIGRVKVDSLCIISDNINGDQKPNPGENIQYKIKLKNLTNYSLHNLRTEITTSLSSYINSYTFPTTVSSLNPIDTSRWIPEYTPFEFNVNKNTPIGHVGKVEFSIADYLQNSWRDTVSLIIENFEYPPIDTLPIHVSGNSEGTFGIILVDHSKLKNNWYNITVKKISQYDFRFNLINSTVNDTLLKLHYLPDYYGHNIPIIDGFRIRTNAITTQSGIKSSQYSPASNAWLTNSLSSYSRIYKNYGIDYPSVGNYILKQSKLSIDSLKIVEIRFSDTNTQKAYRYLSGFEVRPQKNIVHTEFRPFVIDSAGFGYIYQDYEMYPLGNTIYGRTVPFTVWEIDKNTSAERQLIIAIVEKNDSLYRMVNDQYQYIGSGNIDGRWCPTTHASGGSEILHIFSSTYSDTPDTFYTKRNLHTQFNEFDTYYICWPRLVSSTSTFQAGDVLRITPYFPLTENDVFTFNPLKLLSVERASQTPNSFALYNNYPNPFNPQTTIRYEMPVAGKVVLEIYNLLGQKIRTLINEEKDAGRYSVVWNGLTDNQNLVASGVYFYRLVVSSSNPLRSNNYTLTKKMILMR